MMRAFRSKPVWRRTTRAAAVLLGLAAAACAGVYAFAGTYGLNVVLHRGGSLWVPVGVNDPRLSSSMRLALQDRSIVAEPGPMA